MTPSLEKRKADIRHAAVGGLANLLQIFGAVSVPLFHWMVVWAFGPVAYGLYAVAATVAETGGRLATMGSDKSLWRYIASHRLKKEEAQVKEVLKTALQASAFGGLIVAGLVFFLARQLAPYFGDIQNSEAIRWLAPSAPLYALIAVIVSASLGAKVVRFNLLVKGVAQPLLLILCAALMIPFARFETLAMAHLVSLLLTLILAWWTLRFVFPHFSIRSCFKSFSPRWDLLRFSIPLGGSDVLNMLMHRASVVILAFFLEPSEIAAFAACEMLVRAIAGVRNAFDPIISPILSEAMSEKDLDRVAFNLKMTTRWVLFLVLPASGLMILFAPEILSLLNESFASAAAILATLVVAYGINSALGLTGWVLVMGGYSWLVLLNQAITASATLGMAFYFIPKLGLWGAGIATAISVVFSQVLNAVEVLVLQKIWALSWAFFRLLIAGLIAFGLTYFLLEQAEWSGWLRSFGGGSIFITIYLLCWRVFAFQEDERMIFEKLKQRVKKTKPSQTPIDILE